MRRSLDGCPNTAARLAGFRRVTQQGVILYVMDGPCHRVHTQWQWPLSGIYSIMIAKSAQPGQGGGCTRFPFQSIFHHERSCGLCSSWEGRYTPLISPLPLYVLCGPRTTTPLAPTCTDLGLIYSYVHITPSWAKSHKKGMAWIVMPFLCMTSKWPIVLKTRD